MGNTSKPKWSLKGDEELAEERLRELAELLDDINGAVLNPLGLHASPSLHNDGVVISHTHIHCDLTPAVSAAQSEHVEERSNHLIILPIYEYENEADSASDASF